MRRILLVGAVAVALAVVALVPRSGQDTVHANPLAVKTMNVSVCTALTAGAAFACVNPQQIYWSSSTIVGNTRQVAMADALGNNNGIIEPDDFNTAQDLGANHVHQRSGEVAFTLNRLAIIAFVDNDAPVTFRTTRGLFRSSTDTSLGVEFTCTPSFDPDCGGGPAGHANPIRNEDGVVIVTLTCTLATCAELGPRTLTVEQDNIVYPVEFTIVGEARTVEFFTLETAVQAGVPDDATGAPDCEFRADVAFVTASLAQAEKTVVIARGLDIDGTAIAGAWMQWTSSDEDALTVAQSPVTPTLDLGAFGFGAPNIICARRDAVPGDYQVEARLRRTISGGVLADPRADPGNPDPDQLAFALFDLRVQGLPESLTLSADPPEMVCDGQNTSTVRATLADAEGNPALGGTDVRFTVEVLGTADPIVTTTDGEGIARSTVRPVSGLTRGTTVVVTVPITGEQQAILVGCVQGEAVGPEPGEPTDPVVEEQPVGVRPPGTGDGTLGGGSAGPLSWWPALALLAGAMGLGGARLAFRRS